MISSCFVNQKITHELKRIITELNYKTKLLKVFHSLFRFKLFMSTLKVLLKNIIKAKLESNSNMK